MEGMGTFIMSNLELLVKSNVWLIPFLPLMGVVLNGLPTAMRVKLSKSYVNVVACGVMLMAFLMAVAVFATLKGMPEDQRHFTFTLWPWIHVGSLRVDIAFLIDPLSSIMMMIITGIGFLIHVYSIGYMHEEPSYARFFTYLNLFCFMMLLLVMGDNLFVLFVGWEGVGLCSYLLIGFWYEHKPNGIAGMKAFLVNRVGDFGMMIGMLTLFWSLYTVGKPTLTFAGLKEAVPLLKGLTVLGGMPVATFVCLFLFIGATGKSAQIPLYVWLPDAMAGPTPVSALIHAATMVTAGVYMIARMNWLFAMSPVALTVIATVGALTAFLGATIGFAQTDIKKVLAYSTVSQLGYMFLAMGTGAYAAGVFHLMTHAFFKACLFLGSGSVIMGMHHEQDMRLMGGLRKYMPVTFWTFMLATIAIGGIFPFSGFFSKDEILWMAFSKGHENRLYYVLWGVGMAGALGTAFYMMRCVTMTFFGGLRANDASVKNLVHGEEAAHAHAAHDDAHAAHDDAHAAHGHHELVPHESPKSMTFALVVLAVLSVFGGFLNVPFAIGGASSVTNLFSQWLSPVIPHHAHHEAHAIEYALMFASVAFAATFMGLGYWFYTRGLDKVRAFTAKYPNLYDAVLNKYYVDEMYSGVFVGFVLWFCKVCARFDQVVVDGLVNLVGTVTRIYSKIIGWFDRIFVDGLVNGAATICYEGGDKLKRLQTGNIQHYAFGALLGVVAVLALKVMFG